MNRNFAIELFGSINAALVTPRKKFGSDLTMYWAANGRMRFDTTKFLEYITRINIVEFHIGKRNTNLVKVAEITEASGHPAYCFHKSLLVPTMTKVETVLLHTTFDSLFASPEFEEVVNSLRQKR